jgi:3-methylfumaryl-CoA hydratase
LTESAKPTPVDLSTWVGRTERRRDTIAAASLAGLLALLDRRDGMDTAVPGAPIAPLAHWLYFLAQAPQSEIAADGHPMRGGFLPPVPLPRRMWAGGRLRFKRAIRVGQEMERRSTIQRIDAKSGRSGELVFVTLEHQIGCADSVAVTEVQDLVYRDHPRAGVRTPEPAMARTDEEFSREVRPDPVLLFRYSALTFNGHRIHYDRDYAVGVEQYPGLVVQGPLVATLLADLMREAAPGTQLASFEFKAMAPLFDIDAFTLCGKFDGPNQVSLWARTHDGRLAMHATATLT